MDLPLKYLSAPSQFHAALLLPTAIRNKPAAESA